MLSDKCFTRDNLDRYLKELAKEYRKLNGKNTTVEIILIGGASVVINYAFRDMTYDMDAIINASSSIKDAINIVGDRFNLPNGWINDDFMRTSSYTPKIIQYSKYYHTYSNAITFRTVTGEYLIAMKLKAGREYKFDRSDVIGILLEQERNGDPLTLDRIKRAVEELYGSYDVLSDEIKSFIENSVQEGNYPEKYNLIRQAEAENKNLLVNYTEKKPGIVKDDNTNDIIAALKKRKSNP